MKNAVEFFRTELCAPIKRGQIRRHEVAAIAAQILEIARAKVVDHGQARVGMFLLQRQDQVRGNEPGAAGDEEIEVFGVHG